jgi:lipopolysaccharide/colanic/teichoic acid biosynthesis glycosyltransferase
VIDRIEFDSDRIMHGSLSLELKIILLTIPAPLRQS